MVAFSTAGALAADDKDKKPEKKKADPAARFAKLDKDGDGKLDAEEMKAFSKKNPKAGERVLKRKDKDGDSKLSKDEFVAKPEKKKKPAGDKPEKKEEKKDAA